MAKARAIIKRRKAVQNIRKITRTMQLIATARFQAAFNRATASKPYTRHITELVEDLARGQRDLHHPLLAVNSESQRVVHLVITSNRGLCGGYNSSVLREAVASLKADEAAGQAVDLHVAGKKGAAYFRFLRRPLARALTQFEDKPQFAQVEPLAVELMEAYERKQIDAARVTYTRFESTSRQFAETITLLPMERPVAADAQGPAVNVPVIYEFTPPAPELLAELIPEAVKVRLFQCFMDAAVSEQVARMVAMKSATDAAGEMIKTLTRQYNRARQSQITLELLDIVAGAEAIK